MLVVSGGIVATLWVGGEKVFNGTLQVGAILAFINYLNIILMSLMSISMVFMQIARAFPSVDRVQQVLNTDVDIMTPKNALAPKQIEGQIEFKNVSYSYTKNNEYVLKDISFRISKGEKIGIIGSTGSGKSTLAKLLPRLYDVDQGEICIDGINVKAYDLQNFVRQSVLYLKRHCCFLVA